MVLLIVNATQIDFFSYRLLSYSVIYVMTVCSYEFGVFYESKFFLENEKHREMKDQKFKLQQGPRGLEYL